MTEKKSRGQPKFEPTQAPPAMLERQAVLAAIDEAWRIPSPKSAMHD